MLRRLEIENYGLIERAKIHFAQGATMFTGETGSGKTMILGALAFALGARASADVVRRNARKAIVTLAFEPDDAFAAVLNDAGFELDPGEEATIVREMSDAGKSSVRVNGRASTASYVREAGYRIAEIVGQHEAQRLLVPAYHLELLDRFGGSDAAPAREAVAATHLRLVNATRAYDAVQGDEKKALELYEEACYALEEIENAAPQPEEDVHLTQRRRYLDNVEKIAESLRAGHEALAADETSASAAFGMAVTALDGLAPISAHFGEMASQARALQSETTDLATTIARELEATEFDPGELETINARLDVLDRLKRKHGGTLAAVSQAAERARTIRDEFESRDERMAALRDARSIGRRSSWRAMRQNSVRFGRRLQRLWGAASSLS